MPHEQWLSPSSQITPSLVQDRLQELNLLLDTEPLLYQQQDLSTLQSQLTQFVAELLASSHAVVYEYDRSFERLLPRAATGFTGILPHKMSANPSCAEKLWHERRENTLLHADISQTNGLSRYPFGSQPLTVLSNRIDVAGLPWGILQAARPAERPYAESDAQLMRLLSKRTGQVIQILEMTGRRARGFIDPVTQLPTREFFQQQLTQMIQHARRLGNPISLLLIDVDSLDRINRGLGYVAGDKVLAEIASVVRATVRTEDLLGRHHSDEIILGLADAGKEHAKLVAERIQAALAMHAWSIPETTFEPPTVSVSIAVCPEDGTTSDVLLQTAVEQMTAQQERQAHTFFRMPYPLPAALDLNIGFTSGTRQSDSWAALDTDLLWLGMALAAGAVGSKRASVMLMDPDGKRLTLKAGKGFLDDLSQQEVVQDVGEGIAGKVAETGEPLLLTDVTQAGLVSERTDQYQTRSCLSVPIRNGQVIGILNLADKQDGSAFDVSDLQTISELTEVIASPLHSPRAGFLESATSMCRVLEKRFPGMVGHSDQVANYAVLIGQRMGLEETQLQYLREVGWLHDLGEFESRPQIHRKTEPLIAEDWSAIYRHPELGYELCDGVRFLRGYRETIRHHHERPDGKGYPHGQTLSDLSLESRILAVAEAYVGMCSSRPYRPALTIEEAIQELQADAGSRFDEECVAALTRTQTESLSGAETRLPVELHRSS